MKKNENVVPVKSITVEILLMFLVAIVGCTSVAVSAQTDKKMKAAEMQDLEITKMLSSQDRQKSFEAAHEIFKRGEKMIPLLAQNKGNQTPFAWGSLGNPNSGSITFAPSKNPEWDYGRIITVEVASIYLICAIYWQNFEFGQSGYLRSKDEVEFNKYNTRERLAEAWVAVDKWIDMLNREGLNSLREKKIHPLINTRFFF